MGDKRERSIVEEVEEFLLVEKQKYQQSVLVRQGELLTPSQLVEKEHEAAKEFFGKALLLPVLKPPPLLLETQKRLYEDKGVTCFEPFYSPGVLFRREDEFPGWKEKPIESYWDYIDDYYPVYPNRNAAQMKRYWGLVDTSVRPDFIDGATQMFKNDPLGPLLEELREKVDIPSMDDVIPKSSRFGITPYIQDTHVFPRLAREWNLVDLTGNPKATVERLTGIEFNYLGNLRYQYFGQTTTSEWFQDSFDVLEFPPHIHQPVLVYRYRLNGGHAEMGGLKHIGILPMHKTPYEFIAFRPVIKFYEK